MDALPGTKSKREGIRARSRSMVNGVRKLTRLHSFSGSVPRYVPSNTKMGSRELERYSWVKQCFKDSADYGEIFSCVESNQRLLWFYLTFLCD